MNFSFNRGNGQQTVTNSAIKEMNKINRQIWNEVIYTALFISGN